MAAFCGQRSSKLRPRGSHKVGDLGPGLWYGPATLGGRRTGSAARLAGLAALLALAVGSTTAAAGPGSGYRERAGRLRVEAQQLDTRTHRALLDLYALESRLGRARNRLSTLEGRSARLRLGEAALTAQLATARRSLAVARQELAEHLRSLYEEGRPDPLAVVLGAQSLDDAVSKLDTLTRIADQSRRVAVVTGAAELRLTRARTRLARERRALERSLAAARSAAGHLEAARLERLSFVQGLQARQRLQRSQIRTLLATARAVEQRSQELQAASTAPPSEAAGSVRSDGGAPPATTPQPTRPDPPVTAAPSGHRLRVYATGYSLPGHTASGLPVGWGVVAVDPAVIPLGTRLTIPGYGEAVAADVGSGVRGAMIDLWFPTLAQARAWGRRTVTVELH